MDGERQEKDRIDIDGRIGTETEGGAGPSPKGVVTTYKAMALDTG
jgi:hypothetical protein